MYKVLHTGSLELSLSGSNWPTCFYIQPSNKLILYFYKTIYTTAFSYISTHFNQKVWLVVSTYVLVTFPISFPKRLFHRMDIWPYTNAHACVMIGSSLSFPLVRYIYTLFYYSWYLTVCVTFGLSGHFPYVYHLASRIQLEQMLHLTFSSA